MESRNAITRLEFGDILADFVHDASDIIALIYWSLVNKDLCAFPAKVSLALACFTDIAYQSLGLHPLKTTLVTI